MPANRQLLEVSVEVRHFEYTFRYKLSYLGSFKKIPPTVGFSLSQFAIGRFNINLYDLGGSRSIRDIWPVYFPDAHGFIFVVDSSDAQKLLEVTPLYKAFIHHPNVIEKPVLVYVAIHHPYFLFKSGQ